MMPLYERMGRRSKAVIPSQKNCLVKNHRLTCERWGWRFLRRAAFYELLAVKDSSM